MKFSVIKKKVMKTLILFTIWLSLNSSPLAANEILKMMECLSGERDAKMIELDDKGKETDEPRKKNK